MQRFIGLALAAFVLAACLPFPVDAPPSNGQSQQNPCAMVWATEERPDIAQRVQDGLTAAGYAPLSVSAGVFGEACYSNGQQTSGVGALETTVTIGMAVADVHDQEQLGDLAAGIADVLLSLDIPGARKKIDLSFITPDSRGRLFFDLSDARNLRWQGVHGAAFLEAIGGLK